MWEQLQAVVVMVQKEHQDHRPKALLPSSAAGALVYAGRSEMNAASPMTYRRSQEIS